jgi:hypothetical protein
MGFTQTPKNGDGVIRLKSGDTIIANRGILGLSVYPDDNTLYEGYDGQIIGYDDAGQEAEMPPEDRRALAERMIARWKAWGGL